ncbi:MAG TPA: hypothetical protein VKR58_03420 [Aquella sp.]|nr:hypothetical protein [Aquella sp.]
MQSLIVVTIMAIFSIFMLSEMSRNNGTNIYPAFKAENIAANVLQYQDSISQYVITNYDTLYLPVSSSPGHIEQIQIIDYTHDQIAKFNQKNLLPFLNYQSIVFNYGQILTSESQSTPVLYIATSWSGYSSDQIASSYANLSMIEIMGKLGEDLSKYVYQGNSAYWLIPWVFSQNNCQITELYTQLPDDANGDSQLARLQNIFNEFCTQIQAKSSYQFMNYVYLAPIFKQSDL